MATQLASRCSAAVSTKYVSTSGHRTRQRVPESLDHVAVVCILLGIPLDCHVFHVLCDLFDLGDEVALVLGGAQICCCWSVSNRAIEVGYCY